MVTNRDQPDEFQDAEIRWKLNTLYADLAAVKGRALTPIEQRDLRGLLCGYSPQEIAETVFVSPDTVRHRLSAGLYRYVEDLILKKTGVSKKIHRWSQVYRCLETLGYQYSPFHQDVDDNESSSIVLVPELPEESRLVQQWQQFIERSQNRDWQTTVFTNQLLSAIGKHVLGQMRSLREQGNYPHRKQLWQEIKGFTHVYDQYWQDRLRLAEELRQEAEQYGDRAMIAETASEKAWTLTLLDQPDAWREAEALLEEAWTLREYQDYFFRLTLMTHRAVFHLYQNQLDQASQWLREQQLFLNTVHLQQQQQHRHRMNIAHYTGEVCFRDGNYGEARKAYQAALLHARESRWQRAEVSTQNWLVSVALKQNNPQEARSRLAANIKTAEANQDHRCIAFCQRGYAFLYQGEGNRDQAIAWAQQAIHTFQALGMQSEVKGTQDLLKQLRGER